MAIKKKRTEVRREEIIKAAMNIIGAKGIQGLTTARIAKSVGVSEANLYRHFKNKNDIMNAAVDYIEESILNNLKKINEEPLKPLEKLDRILQLHVLLIEENKGIPRIIFSSESLYSKELRDKISSIIKQYIRIISNILRAGVKEGHVHGGVDVDSMSALFIGMIQLTVLRWTLSNFETSLSGEGGKLWRTFRKMIEA